jgi:amyloid beta precursor protein binding protein 1
VTEVDLGNNFFVDEDSLGKSRAATVKDLLLEMNPEVKGSALVRSPVDLIDKELSYFDRFRIVIGCHLPEPSIKKLAAYLFPKNIPFIVLRSEGMLGYARLQVQEHLVYETHPEDDRYDLYLHPEQLASFPELQEYIKTFGDFSGLSDKLHGEIPYPVILVVQMQKWLKEHKNEVPSSWEQQDEFKLQIKKGARNFEEQENWEEAVENASKCYKKATLKDEVKEVFEDEKAKNITKDSAPFWVLVSAINQFIAKEGKGTLPCSPAIPDMTSNSENYVKLQQIYVARAAKDRAAVTEHVRAIQKKAENKHVIADEDINQFCRNFRSVAMVRGRSIAEEYDAKTFPAEALNEIIEEEGPLRTRWPQEGRRGRKEAWVHGHGRRLQLQLFL